MQKIKLFLTVVVLLLQDHPVQAQGQTGTLAVYTQPGAEVLVGCGDIQIGGLANAQGVFTNQFPSGPNCVNSLGKQKAVTIYENQTVIVIFGYDIFLPIIRK